MTQSFLPPLPSDDLPCESYELNVLLINQLEEILCQKFYEVCTPITRVLLSSCHWYFKINAGHLNMIIISYDLESHWHTHNIVAELVKRLKLFANSVKISLYPPDSSQPWEIEVDNA